MSDACPVCGHPWSAQEQDRAARRALLRLRDEMAKATQTTPPAVVTPRSAVETAAAEGTAGGVPIDADREVWSS